MVSTLLSKSGRALLLYPGDGSVWVTSVVYMRMVLDGRSKGPLVWKRLDSAVDNGVGNLVLSGEGKGKVKVVVGEDVLL